MWKTWKSYPEISINSKNDITSLPYYLKSYIYYLFYPFIHSKETFDQNKISNLSCLLFSHLTTFSICSLSPSFPCISIYLVSLLSLCNYSAHLSSSRHCLSPRFWLESIWGLCSLNTSFRPGFVLGRFNFTGFFFWTFAQYYQTSFMDLFMCY